MGYQAAIFDMDGLLIDTESVYRAEMIATAEMMGIRQEDSYYDQFTGMSEERMRQTYIDDFPQFTPAEIDAGFAESKKRIAKRFMAGEAAVKPGVVDLLDFLVAHKIPRIVATSNESEVAALLLNVSGLAKYFDQMVTADDATHAKPDPEIVNQAVEKLGYPKDEIVMFEDSLPGIEACQNAGVDVVMIPDMVQPNDYAKTHTKAIYSTIDQAKELF